MLQGSTSRDDMPRPIAVANSSGETPSGATQRRPADPARAAPPWRAGLRRPRRAGALLAAVTLSASACASGHQTEGAAPRPPDISESATGGALVTSVPGHLTVKVLGGRDLPAIAVAHARVSFLAGGDGELSMSVVNDGSAPEHLAFVSTPDATSTSWDGDVSPAGVELATGRAVTLGRHGAPRVLLHGVHNIQAGRDVPFILGFANVGLVHLQALPPPR